MNLSPDITDMADMIPVLEAIPMMPNFPQQKHLKKHELVHLKRVYKILL